MIARNVKQCLALGLRRIGGQVRGPERMRTERRLCADLLTQISAVQSALKSVGDGVLHCHVRQCVPKSFSRRLRGGKRARLEELENIFAQ